MTQPGNASKARPSHLTTVDAAFGGSSEGCILRKAAKAAYFEGCSLAIETQPMSHTELCLWPQISKESHRQYVPSGLFYMGHRDMEKCYSVTNCS